MTTTREWPTASLRSRLLPAIDEHFVVLTPDRLLLYSLELNLLNQLDLPLSRESVKDDWHIDYSTAGKYILAHYEPETEEKRLSGLAPAERYSRTQGIEIRFELINLRTLQAVVHWVNKTCRGCFSITQVSDEGEVQAVGSTPGTPFDSRSVSVGKPPDGPWSELCPYYQPYCRPGVFVNKETVLSLESTKGLEAIWLVNTHGDLLFHDAFGEKGVTHSGIPSLG